MKKILVAVLFVLLLFIVGCKDESNKKIIINSLRVIVNSEDMNITTDNEHVNSSVSIINADKIDDDHYVLYKAKLSLEKGYEFSIDIVLDFDLNNEVKVNKISKMTDSITIEFKKEIESSPSLKYEIENLEYSFSTDDGKVNIGNENVAYIISEKEEWLKEDNKIKVTYEISINTLDDYEFIPNIDVKWLKDSSEDANVSYMEITNNLIFIRIEKIIKELKEVRIHLDTINYEVSADSAYYNVEIVKPLDYIKIVIKVTSDMKLMDELMFYVNDELIDTSKYKIEYIENKYVLTYKIADPNWTPYY
ncbi:MAG: hypothetical protein J5691_01685 [Bacilli bacterium]|nr:hypothetical protein [Bacilli bacterium]